jgi:hypothetical protein
MTLRLPARAEGSSIWAGVGDVAIGIHGCEGEMMARMLFFM